MGEKDIIEKTLESYNDVFSDIFNVLLFNGETVIKENELTDATPYSMFKADGKIHQQERDVAKYWKGTTFQMSLFGIENQSCIDKLMPARIFSYDGAAYKNQILKKHNKNDFLYPVITIVLYFGKGKWTGPTKLSEILKIPPKLHPYINEFKIFVIPVSYIPKKQRMQFKSDFKFIADFFYQNERNGEYIPTNEEIKHVDEFLKLMKIFSSDNRFEDVYNMYIENKLNFKGGNNMCYILDQVENRGIEKGLEQGKEEIIIKMIENNFTAEQIKACTGISTYKLNKIKAKLVPVHS